MIRPLLILVLVSVVTALSGATANASHWAFRQAPFTHHPVTGQRVTQYAESKPAYFQEDPTYRQAGYIWQNIRIHSQDGGLDHIRLFERWGDMWFPGYPY